MVTVTDYALKTTAGGREFYALVLQGGLCMVQSKNTGNYYATVKRCSIPSTFDEATAKAMVGEKITGSIQKQTCEPYEYINKETGEVIELDYRWIYLPEGVSMQEAVFEGAVQQVI